MDIEVPSLIILNGSQGSGKSHVIRYILYTLRKRFAYGLVFTNTFFDGDAFDYIPKKYVHPQYDEEVLEKLMDIQQKLVEQDKIKEAFVIFDDCMDDPDEFKSSVLKRLTTQLRHYHITVIFSTQYVNQLPARMRTNAMAIIIFQTDTEISLKALYQSYGQKFDSFQDFKTYLMDNIGNYNFVYYKKNELNPKKLYTVMKAPKNIPTFKIKYLTN